MFSSCKTEQQVNDTMYIQLSSFAGKVIDIADDIEYDDSLQLDIPDGIISYKVQDACINDSLIFILDDLKNVISFDAKTGKPLAYINSFGRGHGEYIEPKAICVSQDFLYVLDCTGMTIVQYNRHLQYVKSIRTNVSAIDFVKVDDGFLLYNLNPNKQIKQIVWIDEDGKVKNSYLEGERNRKELITDKMFVRSDEKATYIIDPSTNTLYRFSDGDMLPVINITNNESSQSDCNLLRCFLFGDSIITLYESKGFILTSFYDIKTKKTCAGIVNTHIPYPFTPLLRRDNSLYGIYPANNGDNKYVLVKHVVRSRTNF